MNVQNVYNDIKASLKADWMSELQTETLAVKPTADCDNDQAWSKISDFQPTQGWIQTLDKVHLIENAQMPNSDDQIISAELVNAAQQSLHIRPASKGRLTVTRYTSGQGDSYYVTQTLHQIKHVTKTENGIQTHTGNAVYQLYWPTNQTQTQPAFSRLVEITR